ncbi:MAG: ABC transporter permease [Roseinatronobacter sp.]|nr:ABC transporter permease [Roseinatronobacter sp.]
MAQVESMAHSMARPDWRARFARQSEAIIIPLSALVLGLAGFALFLFVQGKSPVQFFQLVWLGGFGTGFSWQNTLSRAAPLLLAGLCVAIPARLGLVVIGGEGAIVMGGVAAGAAAIVLSGLWAPFGIVAMAAAGALAGALWIGAVGALRHWRGVNETISSLLLAYIAIALMNHLVEGPLRDPASLNKPSTPTIDAALAVGKMPWPNVHWGRLTGVFACILTWILLERTAWGFAARMAGSNLRAAQVQGLPVGALILGFTAFAGCLAGLAGYFEVAAVHGSANASLAAGYGYSGILVAFLARHNPLAIIPVALLLAGFEASSGLLQRRMGLPDASVLVLQGFVFVAILASEAVYGRLRLFSPERWSRA